MRTPASRIQRSPLHNHVMFIAELPALFIILLNIFRPYGTYEATYQMRAHLRRQGQAMHRSLQHTRPTLPSCRAPLHEDEDEHEGTWAARKSANHRCKLRQRIGFYWRAETLASAGGHGVPS